MAKVSQLFSGSSGNSIYISSGNAKFLVDAGVSAKKLEKGLNDIDVAPDEIDALFITHEHIDHIKGMRVFASRYNIPVFAQKDVLSYMQSKGDVNGKVIAYDFCNMELKGADIKSFALSHDSSACVGYRFDMPDGRSISVCTDTGFVTEEAKKELLGSDMVFLESNHEITMLENGFYPYNLKKRILSDCGHLSNNACAEFAKELVQSGTTRIVLSHLSRENNHPDIARQTTLSALNEAGFEENSDFRIKVAAQENYERPIIL